MNQLADINDEAYFLGQKKMPGGHLYLFSV